MRSRLMSASVALMALGALGLTANTVYVEGVNNDLPVEDGWTASGGNENAYRWTAQNSFELIEILWHTSSITDGVIRLREDTGTTPGAILAQATFNATGTDWHGAEFDFSYPIDAGQTYFVTFESSNSYTDYLAEGGELLTYYWTPRGGSEWNGPYDWAGARMIEFYAPGEDTGCAPTERIEVLQ